MTNKAFFTWEMLKGDFPVMKLYSRETLPKAPLATSQSLIFFFNKVIV
jgi:hypothetical protein